MSESYSIDKLLLAISGECQNCLLSPKFPDVVIMPSGLCNYCSEYEHQKALGEFAVERLYNAVEDHRGSTIPDCVCAFSGGKDSAAALVLAVQYLGLHPIALLFDNGFIPKEVVKNSRYFTEKLGVDMVVIQESISSEVYHVLSGGKMSASPCKPCISKLYSHIRDFCSHHRIRLVISGHRTTPLIRPIKFEGLYQVAPLIAYRLPEAEQIRLITSLGWKDTKLPGNTTNCRLVGYAEDLFYEKFGISPHIYNVSAEIRAGFYSREEGLRRIIKPDLSKTERNRIEKLLKRHES